MQAGPDTGAREAILRVHHAWLDAEREGRDEDVLALCCDDLRWRPPGEPELVGIDAVRAWLRAQPAGHILDLAVAAPDICLAPGQARKSAAFRTLWRGVDASWPTLVLGRHDWRVRPGERGWRVAEVAWQVDRIDSPQLLLRALRRGVEARRDRLELCRRDGSVEAIDMPRQGILPHDLVHAVVESALPGLRGFLGLVADGARPAFVLEATDRSRADPSLPGAVQVEAVVEALQAQLWSGGFDAEAFASGVALACDARGIAPPALDGVDPRRLFDAASALHARWQALPAHGMLELGFPLFEPPTGEEASA